MSDYIGCNVSVNPDILKLAIKRTTELTAVCNGLVMAVGKLNDSVNLLRDENEELKDLIKNICNELKESKCSDLLEKVSDDRDYRLFADVFRDKLSVRAYNCIRLAGIKVMADFEYVSLKDIPKIRNLGQASVRCISDEFEKEGLFLPANEEKKMPDASIKEGDSILLLCDYQGLTKGSVLTVSKVFNRPSTGRFSLINYSCKYNSKDIWLTPSMVRKV